MIYFYDDKYAQCPSYTTENARSQRMGFHSTEAELATRNQKSATLHSVHVTVCIEMW